MVDEIDRESTIYLEKAKFLYHGTDSNHLCGIDDQKALVPSNEHGYETNYELSLKSVIYVTTSITRAINWARISMQRNGGRQIILKIPKEAITQPIIRDRNLLWDEMSFQIEDGEIRIFEVIEEDDFWNEIKKAYGFTNGIPAKDYIEIRYAIDRNWGKREELSEIPESFKEELGFKGLK